MNLPKRIVNVKLPITGTRTKLKGLRHPSWNINPAIKMGMVKMKPNLGISKRVATIIADEKAILTTSFFFILTSDFFPVTICFLTLKKPDKAVNTIPIVNTTCGHQAEPRGSIVPAGSERDVIYKNSIPKKITP